MTTNRTLAGNLDVDGTFTLGNFTIIEEAGKLVFAYQGTAIASLDSTGNFTTLNNVTAFGTP